MKRRGEQKRPRKKKEPEEKYWKIESKTAKKKLTEENFLGKSR